MKCVFSAVAIYFQIYKSLEGDACFNPLAPKLKNCKETINSWNSDNWAKQETLPLISYLNCDAITYISFYN